MAKTATHAGHCQVCESLQLLPGGRLSKHGYTTRFGFFEGTCFGSDELPYEQSIGLVLDSIERATARRQQLVSEIETLRTYTAPVAWVRIFRPARFIGGGRRQPSGYEWHRVELTRTETERETRVLSGAMERWTDVRFTFTNPVTQKVEELNVPYTVGKDMANVVRHFNGLRCAALDQTVSQVDAYVARQRERINGWEPAPLTPRAGYRK